MRTKAGNAIIAFCENLAAAAASAGVRIRIIHPLD